MKIVHVPFCFRPDPMGGTEVYVEALAREQQRHGLQAVLAAPGRTSAAHVDDDLLVRRFAVSDVQDLNTLYGGGDQIASREFAEILDREQPDIVHLHAFTSAVSVRVGREVRRRGVPLVFTYHTPTTSCQRGTLLRWGRAVCDGMLDVHACASCTLQGLGLSRWKSVMLGALPPPVGEAFAGLGLTGGPWTGLRMTELMRRQHAAFRAFMLEVDRVVVLCRWAGELLVRNGIPERKLVLSRHGLPGHRGAVHVSRPLRGQLRIAFLGRLHPTKGLDILLGAIRSLPDAALELDVFGIPEDHGGNPYADELQTLAASDPRIQFLPPVPNGQVAALLPGYDVVAVPSRWLETGPLVVLEAFAAGVPVIGSKLGGIAELVDDGVDGLLVETESEEAWRTTLWQLSADPNLLQRLRSGIRPPRRMEDVADDMRAIYSELLSA